MSCWSDIRRGDDITQQSALSGTVTGYRCTGGSAGDPGSPQPRGGHGHNAILSHWGHWGLTGQSILLPAEVLLHSLLPTVLSVVLFPDVTLPSCVECYDVYVSSIYSRKTWDCDILKMFILSFPVRLLIKLIH